MFKTMTQLVDEMETEQYRKQAEKGDAEAQYNLGLRFGDGTGVVQDEKAAVKWYRKAADKGHVFAQYNLAVCLITGKGVRKNEKEAVEWFRKAAKKNFAPAQANLALCLANGDGVDRNEKEAAEWYLKAAEKGHANAQFKLGVCLENGRGTDKDEKAAVTWYSRAAEQGNVLAQINLALCLRNGRGTVKDEKAAVSWFSKAAERGNAVAQNNLGFCLQNAIGTVKDEKKAVECYRKAAEKGLAIAQNNLGFCLVNAIGTVKDVKEAVEWYRKAAEQGEVLAQSNLAFCLRNGIGTAKDEKEAFKWYHKAAEQGHESAKEELVELSAKLSDLPSSPTTFIAPKFPATQDEKQTGQGKTVAQSDKTAKKAKKSKKKKKTKKMKKLETQDAQAPAQPATKVKEDQTGEDQKAVNLEQQTSVIPTSGPSPISGISKSEDLEQTTEPQDAEVPVQLATKVNEDQTEEGQKAVILQKAKKIETEEVTERKETSANPLSEPSPILEDNIILEIDRVKGALDIYFSLAHNLFDIQLRSYAEAMILLIKDYYKDNIEVIIKIAREWAKNGDYKACVYLVVCYLDDKINRKEEGAEGIAGLRKLAEQGDSNAQYHLGLYLKEECAIAQDVNEANEWFRKSAAQGNHDAQSELDEQADLDAQPALDDEVKSQEPREVPKPLNRDELLKLVRMVKEANPTCEVNDQFQKLEDDIGKFKEKDTAPYKLRRVSLMSRLSNYVADIFNIKVKGLKRRGIDSIPREVIPFQLNEDTLIIIAFDSNKGAKLDVIYCALSTKQYEACTINSLKPFCIDRLDPLHRDIFFKSILEDCAKGLPFREVLKNVDKNIKSLAAEDQRFKQHLVLRRALVEFEQTPRRQVSIMQPSASPAKEGTSRDAHNPKVNADSTPARGYCSRKGIWQLTPLGKQSFFSQHPPEPFRQPVTSSNVKNPDFKN